MKSLNDIYNVLSQMLAALLQLVARLAPPRGTIGYVKFNPNQAVAGYTVSVPLNRPYNNLQISLLTGEVWMYYGDGSGNSTDPGVPDKRFSPTPNPLPLPFGDRRDSHLTFYIPANSQPVSGTIEVQYY